MRLPKLPRPLLVAAIMGLGGCLPEPVDADRVLADLDAYYGKSIVMRAQFRSGARCSVADENGMFRTYCKGDCRYCKGPLVVDSSLDLKENGLSDWPMILAGSWNNRDIRCRGPLENVRCYPFEPGKTYVVRGRLEAHRPPRLLVQDFWEDDTPPKAKRSGTKRSREP